MTAEDDIPGKLGELGRYGRIDSVDIAGGRIAVRVGDIVSQPVPWFTGAAGGTRIWLRPKVGEQVFLLAPDGDIEGAIALRGVSCNAFPTLGDEDRELIRFEDGAEIAYDPASHELEARLPGGGKARVEASGGITLIGDVSIEGKLSVTEDAQFDAKIHANGEIKSDIDVVADTIKLKTHKHTGVTAGGALSGVPQ